MTPDKQNAWRPSTPYGPETTTHTTLKKHMTSKKKSGDSKQKKTLYQDDDLIWRVFPQVLCTVLRADAGPPHPESMEITTQMLQLRSKLRVDPGTYKEVPGWAR